MSMEQIIEWIMKNRTGAAFKDYSKEKIEMELYEAMFFCVFRAAFDEQGNMIGVVCGSRDINKKQIFIHDILVTKPDVVKLFIKSCNDSYPDYELHGIKENGKQRVFKTPMQLLERL